MLELRLFVDFLYQPKHFMIAAFFYNNVLKKAHFGLMMDFDPHLCLTWSASILMRKNRFSSDNVKVENFPFSQ